MITIISVYLVYLLGKAMMAVMRVIHNTSVIGYLPSIEFLRYWHHRMLAFKNNAPYNP